MKKITFLVLALSLISFSANAAMPNTGGTKYLTVGGGFFDATRDGTDTLEYRLEYHHNYVWKSLYPSIGINGTDEGSVYYFVGVNYDFMLAKSIYLTPNFAVGYYDRNGGKNLGGPLEFRSGLELGVEFNNKHRLGLGVSHLSNASLYDRNPGEESVFLSYSIPLANFTK